MLFDILNDGYCHICRVIGKKMRTSQLKVTFCYPFTYWNIVLFFISSTLSNKSSDAFMLY